MMLVDLSSLAYTQRVCAYRLEQKTLKDNTIRLKKAEQTLVKATRPETGKFLFKMVLARTSTSLLKNLPLQVFLDHLKLGSADQLAVVKAPTLHR
jgi:hypothetical protein